MVMIVAVEVEVVVVEVVVEVGGGDVMVAVLVVMTTTTTTKQSRDAWYGLAATAKFCLTFGQRRSSAARSKLARRMVLLVKVLSGRLACREKGISHRALGVAAVE